MVCNSGEKIRLSDLKPIVCRVIESISFLIELNLSVINFIDSANISCFSITC